jgi:hypothetical protein
MVLLCDLTDEEIRLKSQEVGEAVIQQASIESAKKEANKEFGEQLATLRQRMRMLANQIRSRTEMRMVQCQIEFHVPQVGFKRTVRLDTGEVVKEQPMTEDELNARLFEDEAAAKVLTEPDPSVDAPATENEKTTAEDEGGE